MQIVLDLLKVFFFTGFFLIRVDMAEAAGFTISVWFSRFGLSMVFFVGSFYGGVVIHGPGAKSFKDRFGVRPFRFLLFLVFLSFVIFGFEQFLAERKS